jgi:hypothetical protein
MTGEEGKENKIIGKITKYILSVWKDGMRKH